MTFEESAGKTASLFYDIVRRGNVTPDELKVLAPLAPSEIGFTSTERDLYQDILLKPADAQDADARSRRLTVLLVLHIAALLQRDPKPDEVRWILYASCGQNGTALALSSPELEAQRQLWWIYQANDLCHVALETLLKFSLDTLGEHPGGITLSRLIPLCVSRIFATAGHTPDSWGDFIGALQPPLNAYASEDSEWSLADNIMKRAGRTDARLCPPETAWMAIRLLAILHRRVREEGRDIASVFGEFNADGFHSLLTETRYLDRHMSLPFPDLLSRLIEERVIQRHLWVALQKFRAGDYTFLIERDEGKLRLREKDGPVFTNPRLGPAITFLKDIHVIGGQGLTDCGALAVGVA